MTLFLDNYLNIDFSLFFGLHHMRRSNPLKRHLGFYGQVLAVKLLYVDPPQYSHTDSVFLWYQ